MKIKMTKKGIIILISILSILILATAVVFLCCNEEQGNDEQGDVVQGQEQEVQEEIISNLDTSDWKTYRNEGLGFEIKGLNLSLNLKEPNCSDISIGEKELGDNYISKCKEIYKGNSIGKYLEVEIKSSSDNKYPVSNLDLLKFFYDDMGEKLEKYVDDYNNYINKIKNGSIEEYKISLYLIDDLGKEEVIRFYATKNTKNISNEDLKFWSYCEAGCIMSPKEIVGNYIIWNYNLNPSSGAGDKCWRVGENERGTNEKYEGYKQTKCVISTNLFRNYSIKEVN